MKIGGAFVSGDFADEVVNLDGCNIDKIRIRHIEDVA